MLRHGAWRIGILRWRWIIAESTQQSMVKERAHRGNYGGTEKYDRVRRDMDAATDEGGLRNLAKI